VIKIVPYLLTIGILGCVQQEADRWEFNAFHKPDENPILEADSSYMFTCPVTGTAVQWQKADVFNPAAIVKDGRVYVLFRAEDNPDAILGGRTSRIGLAWSDDGIHFTKHPEPVLYPDSGEFIRYDYPGGCEDPRIVETEEGTYVLTYTSWNHDIARLSVAFSKDLMHWEKKGPAFARAHGGRFLDFWSKSGSIVCRMEEGRLLAEKIDDKYWMYWGEDFINLAWSENLADWYPVLNAQGELLRLVTPRPGKFDSRLTECGPPAMVMNGGIVLFYNGKNAEGDDCDPDLPRGTYSVGKLVFDAKDPKKVLFRSDSCLLKPTLPHEVSGQYASGTTFAEGLVSYRSRWIMYYGTADSYVGVAISEQN
jgi:predicted GH43/DUF377 family glycosyl hydrolase